MSGGLFPDRFSVDFPVFSHLIQVVIKALGHLAGGRIDIENVAFVETGPDFEVIFLDWRSWSSRLLVADRLLERCIRSRSLIPEVIRKGRDL